MTLISKNNFRNMSSISFTIKSDKPRRKCPSDLLKVIKACHLDIKCLEARVDETTLDIGDLCFRDIVLDNTDPVVKNLCSKIYNPLVRVSIPQISMDINMDWTLTDFDKKILVGRNFEIDICSL